MEEAGNGTCVEAAVERREKSVSSCNLANLYGQHDDRNRMARFFMKTKDACAVDGMGRVCMPVSERNDERKLTKS